MAVGKLRYNVLWLQVGLLRVAVLYWNVHRSLCLDLVPSLTIRPKSLLLGTINDTFDESVSIGCATTNQDAQKASSIKEMTLTLQFYESNVVKPFITATSLKRVAALTTDFAADAGKYVVSGQIAATVAEPSVFTVTIRSGLSTCHDSAWFACILKYKDLDGHTKETNDGGLLDVAPTEIYTSRTPKDDITVGMTLKLYCEGIIGTPRFDIPAMLLWVYTNRESALQNQYSPLDQQLLANMKHGATQVVTCSEKQSVSLEFTVDEVRDSMRDYYCVVSRVYAKGAEVIYIGRGDNKISMPDFSKPKEEVIGIGGYIGIGLALFAVLLCGAFVVVWFKRRQTKKNERKEELDRRKSMIEERRKSIAEFVQLKQTAEPTAVAESSEMISQSEELEPPKAEEPSESEAHTAATEEGSAVAAEEGSEAAG